MKFVTFAWAFALALSLLVPSAEAKVFFSDNFPGTTLNSHNWNYCLPDGDPTCSGGDNWQNDQWVSYAVQVNNGLSLYVAEGGTTNGRQYAASMINSYQKFHAMGGWIQAEMKMPSGNAAGYWPAFWLLPASFPSSGKVQNFEIDAEWLGNDPNTVYFTLHGHANGVQTQIAQFKAHSDTLSSQFHDYTFNWTPGKLLEFRLDGAVVGTVTGNNVPNEPMFMVLNNNTMGTTVNWNGNVPNSATQFPRAMAVKYVAVVSN